MTRRHGFDWDGHPELVSQLIELWDQHITSSDIAKMLGHGLTRCAIIGKVHRLGLPSHANVKVHPKTKQTAKPKPIPVKAPAPEKPAFLLEPESFGTDKQCKHIEGDIRDPGWQMCGQPVVPKHSWCEYHRLKNIDIEGTKRIKKH